MDLICFGRNRIPVTVALTDEEKIRGLMYKKSPHSAMVFPFEQAMYRKFWMKDTSIPLDIVFCRDNVVVALEEGVPFSLKEIGPNQLCDLVVEFPRGMVQCLGIGPGQVFKLVYSLPTIAKKCELTIARNTLSRP